MIELRSRLPKSMLKRRNIQDGNESTITEDFILIKNALKLQLAKFILYMNDLPVHTNDKTYHITARKTGIKNNTLSVEYVNQRFKLRLPQDVVLPENCEIKRRYRK